MNDSTTVAGASASSGWLERGTPAYRRANIALFAAGFATFSSLYSVQPLMPLFSHNFAISPAQSSLSLSITTGVLAFTLFFAGLMSEAIDRKRLMSASLIASALLSLAAALSPDWYVLLAARALEGVALGGVPALAMAYLSEEMRPGDLGTAMGLYVGGSAFGGMSGRVLAGVIADIGGWRPAIALIGGMGFVAAAAFVWLLPPSRNFRAQRGLALRDHFAPIGRHLRHDALPWLFACGFVLMGSFVSIYNYIGYRLAAAPFSMSQSAVGAIFVVYLLGIVASAVFGRLADRHGSAPVLLAAFALMSAGLGCMWVDFLPSLVVGIALLTIGFFAGHSVASGWVGPLADGGKGQAAGLYLLAYYLGSSVIGSLGGLFWARFAWPGVTAMVAVLLAFGMIAILRLMVWRRQQ
ncbi:MFS transporter [Salinisphaera aquimarina]|uniref:MFS transporter n=1 Tax=Salinisphaera aquimarina TaxID=2094031 RepID=A0ABV7EVN9_9GAMM